MANFKVIADTELRTALAAHASGRITYESGEFIFRQGTKSSGVYLVATATTVRSHSWNAPTIVRRDLGLEGVQTSDISLFAPDICFD